MLSDGVLQMGLFSDDICEVELDNVSYILHRNPLRREEIAKYRKSKLESLCSLAKEQSQYLADHPLAIASKSLDWVNSRIQKLKANKWVSAEVTGRVVSIAIDEAARDEAALLDGCYVVKSDVSKGAADSQTLHDRYCDLEMGERSFRTMKTSHLELRPVFVRKRENTQGQVFVVVLALILQRTLESSIITLDITVEEAIGELSAVHLLEFQVGDSTACSIPSPTKLGEQILKAADIKLPTALPGHDANVHTKKKLPTERKKK